MATHLIVRHNMRLARTRAFARHSTGMRTISRIAGNNSKAKARYERKMTTAAAAVTMCVPKCAAVEQAPIDRERMCLHDCARRGHNTGVHRQINADDALICPLVLVCVCLCICLPSHLMHFNEICIYTLVHTYTGCCFSTSFQRSARALSKHWQFYC